MISQTLWCGSLWLSGVRRRGGTHCQRTSVNAKPSTNSMWARNEVIWETSSHRLTPLCVVRAQVHHMSMFTSLRTGSPSLTPVITVQHNDMRLPRHAPPSHTRREKLLDRVHCLFQGHPYALKYDPSTLNMSLNTSKYDRFIQKTRPKPPKKYDMRA